MSNTLDDWMVNEEAYVNNAPRKALKADKRISKILADEAWRLYNARRSKEALILIRLAVEGSPDYINHNIKAIILEDLDRFSESLKSYDEALSLNPDNKIIISNKIRMLYKWANSLNDKNKALEIIKQAIDLVKFTDDVDTEKLWYLKGSIEDCLGDIIEAQKSYLIAEGEFDQLKIIEEQQNILKNSKDTLINITGTQFYFGNEIFKEGLIVDLTAEPSNEHDPDAVRVEIDGEKVGYVANSEYTVIESVKSASEIKDSLNDNQKAEVLFNYLGGYVVARLI